MEVPAHIRIEVPVEEFGDAYAGQWVERRQRVGGPPMRQLDELDNVFKEDEQFETVSEIMSTIFTDWNLEGDSGPLPKPWGNPEAFKALLDSDMDLTLWVLIQSRRAMLQLVQPSKN